MGEKLAHTIARQLGPKALAAIDVVMAIPETSVTSAKVVAQVLGKELVEGVCFLNRLSIIQRTKRANNPSLLRTDTFIARLSCQV